MMQIKECTARRIKKNRQSNNDCLLKGEDKYFVLCFSNTIIVFPEMKILFKVNDY